MFQVQHFIKNITPDNNDSAPAWSLSFDENITSGKCL
jgi:hypothetical protein